ncbi:MAG: acetoin utilization protein AcuC [Gammaproteobacteria bacterium]|nr:acetoin utilization protein AcuC [Gammaproteobacteria bacterium]MCP4088917.1 acetoin utilization protein AcuC [Gammaproteobacteria bacterium]MCP4274933.1 acetoin utilization protein AcuC [Gammaproteobacteria bacterium]MCP4832000.1 acetoin utilization protein AcuC [Gammaproteobacteria bacterium]MCP4929435.1 acetoin utilization protein AcuC [Gammaproteobacteria bacterium]
MLVIKDQRIARYGFGEGHPFGPDRHDVFHNELEASGVAAQVVFVGARKASCAELAAYHTHRYIEYVREACKSNQVMLDTNDTPAFVGLFEAAAWVAGGTLNLVDGIMAGKAKRGFIPIGGLHHAGRDHTAGFCVFNDCGIAAEVLRADYGLQRIAYVDIDAHHGDGMYYAFEEDPGIYIADIHEDGRALFPGTGHARECGKGLAEGTKLNIPLRPRADDKRFLEVWEKVEAFLEDARPEFILFQCGADSIAGDPIAHLQFTPEAHAHAARRLCAIADRHCEGRIIAMGGGGYNRDNLARGWTAVVRELAAKGT